MSQHKVLVKIVDSFVASANRNGFNGTVASTLLQEQNHPDRLKKILASLIESKSVTAVFAAVALNMHIKRLPDLPVEKQLELLATEKLDDISLYPSAAEVRKRVDIASWQNRPFSKQLLLGEPQLAFRAFDMGALERYVSDPRYHVDFDDYMGWMSINNDFFTNEEHPERDKVSLQTFGLGFDSRNIPYAIVFLRYLADLSPEHQQYWFSYLAAGDVRMCKEYYTTSIIGDFYENRSIRYAISEELRLIQELSKSIWGRGLFREQGDGHVPIGLTSFLRPTAENFNRFIMALDKLLSERIDYSFFEEKCSLETEIVRDDGKVVVQKKGSLTLLQEWLQQAIVWDDPDAFVDVVIKPLRKIRRLRQKPAHDFTTDDFSIDYYEKRKEILSKTLNSLSNIRGTFANHPLAKDTIVPEWLDSGRIHVF